MRALCYFKRRDNRPAEHTEHTDLGGSCLCSARRRAARWWTRCAPPCTHVSRWQARRAYSHRRNVISVNETLPIIYGMCMEEYTWESELGHKGA